MPYINKEDRFVANEIPRNCGELNYFISKALNGYIKTNKLSYQTINDIVGALEGAKLEFYRRVAKPYEDNKLAINGDVYDFASSNEGE